jgi:aspartate carbamoyltransferase catalytic subunit
MTSAPSHEPEHRQRSVPRASRELDPEHIQRPAEAAAEGSLLDLRSIAPDRLRRLLAAARDFDTPDQRRVRPRNGRLLANLFFEDSTRTRVSFSVAAARLGADVVDLNAIVSSRSKGETLEDTARTIEAMGADAMVVRSHEPGGPAVVARAVGVPVISAGDGRHEHPTQGLLDAYTIAEAHDRLRDFDLSGLTVLIVGDLAHSRVARSDIAGLTALGARVLGVGPSWLAPPSLACLGCEITPDFDDALAQADAVQMLRVQKERGAATGSYREYIAGYQLNRRRQSLLKPSAVVMHPGPMNRGVEITGEVAESHQSRITRMVSVGVLARMAALREALTLTDQDLA